MATSVQICGRLGRMPGKDWLILPGCKNHENIEPIPDRSKARSSTTCTRKIEFQVQGVGINE
jgi:hypothetical protein